MGILIAIGTLFVVALIIGVSVQVNVSKDRNIALSKIEGFKPVVRYEGTLGQSGLALDPASNRFAIMRGSSVRVFPFADLIAVEVAQNGGSLSRTNRGSQATGAFVGGLLLGPAGFLVGGLSGKRSTTELVKRLSLKLFTNDLVEPVHEIVFFKDHQGKPVDSMFVRSAAEKLDQWHGRFRTILAMQERAVVAPGILATENITTESTSMAPTPELIARPIAERKGWLSRTFGA